MTQELFILSIQAYVVMKMPWCQEIYGKKCEIGRNTRTTVKSEYRTEENEGTNLTPDQQEDMSEHVEYLLSGLVYG